MPTTRAGHRRKARPWPCLGEYAGEKRQGPSAAMARSSSATGWPPMRSVLAAANPWVRISTVKYVTGKSSTTRYLPADPLEAALARRAIYR